MKKLIVILLLTALALTSCVGPFKVGDVQSPNCRLKFYDIQKGLTFVRGELIFADEKGILLLKNERLYFFGYDDFYDLKVSGFSNRDEMMMMFTPIVIFDGLIGLSALTSGAAGPSMFFLTHGLCSWIVMTLDEPKTVFKPPLSEKSIAQLKLYARYPQGLTEEQMGVLLKWCGQESVYTAEGSRR